MTCPNTIIPALSMLIIIIPPPYNFNYYGLTNSKKDFYYVNGTKHSRGTTKGSEGEWRDRI